MGDQITDVDPNAFLMGGGTPSAKFEQVGDMVEGFIMRVPEVQQQTNFDTKQPEFWPDGNPKLQVKVVLMTDQRDPADPEDDGQRAIYIAANKQKAVQVALIKAGVKGLEIGGKLRLTYSGDGVPSARGRKAPKLYEALYRPPAVELPSQEPVAAATAPASNSTAAPF